MLKKNINLAIHPVNWALNDVVAFTTTRLKPFSSNNPSVLCNPFSDFNLALHVGDDEKLVLANRHLLAKLLPEHKNIQWLQQVHSNGVHHAKEWNEQAIKADACFTTNRNIALAIMTADCLPILLTNEQGNEIAAIHGGWRPLASNIISHTLSYFSCQPENITAWLGPCIGKQAFEVGKEVFDIFIALDENFKLAFQQIRAEKYIADLHGIAALQLKMLGINKLFYQADCTFGNTQKYYSYRAEGQTGRMASVIYLK